MRWRAIAPAIPLDKSAAPCYKHGVHRIPMGGQHTPMTDPKPYPTGCPVDSLNPQRLLDMLRTMVLMASAIRIRTLSPARWPAKPCIPSPPSMPANW